MTLSPSAVWIGAAALLAGGAVTWLGLAGVSRLPIGPPSPPVVAAGKSREETAGEWAGRIVTERFRGKGLYFLDEPEAGLSPSRQMALLVRMHDLVESGSQFIIATHSPLLMTYPGAAVFLFDESGVREGGYRETEHFQLSRRFLEEPEQSVAALLDLDYTLKRRWGRCWTWIFPEASLGALLELDFP